jgi:hypothetical protein
MKAGYYEKENSIGNDVDVNAAVSWRLLCQSWRLWQGLENTTATMMAIIDYYSAMNFREAENKFVKLCFNGRQLREKDKLRYL